MILSYPFIIRMTTPLYTLAYQFRLTHICFDFVDILYLWTLNPIYFVETGEISFNADSVRQLRAHSQSDKSTYAYYFTNLYHAPPQSGWWDAPVWLKKSADHADEIAFVWGALLTEGSYSSFAKGYYHFVIRPSWQTQHLPSCKKD